MEDQVIDAHVHFGAPPDEASGCYWSDEFEKTAAYWAMLLLTKNLFKKIDIHSVKKHLFKVINRSKKVNKVVLLALDQVYDERGVVHPEKTHLHAPNAYIAELAKIFGKILFGASVHPYRKDWESELDWCLEHEAVLCKWIPSAQLIDMSKTSKLKPFYKKLAHHALPLLCHCGPEYAIPTSNPEYNEFNNPKYLRAALDEGVPVIVAHCAMPYFGPLDKAYFDDFDEFVRLVKEAPDRGWKLYGDLSAICSPLRSKWVKEVQELLQQVELNNLIFGSDYPIPLSELSYNKRKHFLNWLRFVFKVMIMKNPLDKNRMLIREMDFDDSVFTNFNRLIAAIKR